MLLWSTEPKQKGGLIYHITDQGGVFKRYRAEKQISLKGEFFDAQPPERHSRSTRVQLTLNFKL